MIFVKDAKDLRYVRFNQAGAALIGTTTQELIGKSDYDFFPREQADFFTRKDRETLAAGMLVDIPEEPLNTKSQGLRILHTRKIPIPGADGRARYLLGMSQDITERKQTERQISELNAQLQVRATQLEATIKELESFSYTVSHDLRAPLRAIGGYVRMLEADYHDKLDNEARRFLGVIGENTRRMGTLIDDLLAFAKVGRQSLACTEVDMAALVREAFADLTEPSDQASPELILDTLPVAHGDRQLLRQVWVNLLSNAVKYSGNTPYPRIEVTARTDSTEHVYCVKDNGVGFDMKHYDKLFGVFVRLHDAKEFSGTGVGLAIVQRIVERHAGRVWAQAKLDEGATFYFSLPKEQSAR
jgi:PAS domain S-box-containing protein